MLLAGPISHTSTQYMDFVEIFNILLDLSAIYFAYFNGCTMLSFHCGIVATLPKNAITCLSGVKLSIRSFLFYFCEMRRHGQSGLSFVLKKILTWVLGEAKQQQVKE